MLHSLCLQTTRIKIEYFKFPLISQMCADLRLSAESAGKTGFILI